MKKILLSIYLLATISFLLYLLAPSQTSIGEFESLPKSVKSSLEGDTIQVPNVAAYFSNNYRNFSLDFYSSDYKSGTLFTFEPVHFVHPPEFAFSAIKDQTQSTYLVELTYPLRDSLFVNGLEPFDEITKEKRFSAASDLVADDGNTYETKVTLRYYPSQVWARIVVWLGINLNLYLLYTLYRKVVANA